MTVIQIEDYMGKVIGAILTDNDIEIINVVGFDVADIEDFDEIFGTTDNVIRIQINNQKINFDSSIEADWEADKLDNMIKDTLPDDEYW